LPAVIVLFFLVFSPTINIVLVDDPIPRAAIQLVAGIFAVVFMLRYRLTPHGSAFLAFSAVLAGLSLLTAPFASQDIITVRKIVGLVMVAMIIPKVADDHAVALSRFLVFVLVANLALVALQILGHPDWVYRFITYENEGATPVNLAELLDYFGEQIRIGYLPQLRPSGAFPAPTYLSLVLILLWYGVASAPAYRSRSAAVCVGVLGILSGSSVGLVLSLISIAFLPFNGRLIYTVVGAAATMWLYAAYLPWQFDYNFNIEEFIAGFTSRLDLQEGGESIIQQRPYLFAAGVVAGLFTLLFAKRLRLLTLARATFAIAFPVLLHDVVSSLLYWMLVALAVSSHTSIRFVVPVTRHAVPQTMPLRQ
jgi:hypothetical protein